MHEGAHAPLVEYRIFIHVFLLLQIQQVTLLLRPSTWKSYASLVAVSCLVFLFLSFLTFPRDTKYIRNGSTWRHQSIIRKYYPTLIWLRVSPRENFENVFFVESEEKVTWKQQTVFSSVPSDFKWSFLHFVQPLASIYIYCETREVEIFLFCFSRRVNRWIG